MTCRELPFRATSGQACAWLAQQTGTPWSLARLIEHRLTPSVWVEYENAGGGFALPLRIQGDARQLGSAEDVQVTLGDERGNGPQIVSKLRFLKKDLERLARKLTQPG